MSWPARVRRDAGLRYDPELARQCLGHVLDLFHRQAELKTTAYVLDGRSFHCGAGVHDNI